MILKEKWPWFLLAFALFVSSLYEYGYWSIFGVNVFEYFQIQDVLKNFLFVVFSSANPFWFALIAYNIIMSAEDNSVHWVSNLQTEKIADGRVIVKPSPELNFYQKSVLFILNMPNITRMVAIFMLLLILFLYERIEEYPGILINVILFLVAFELAFNKAIIFFKRH